MTTKTDENREANVAGIAASRDHVIAQRDDLLAALKALVAAVPEFCDCERHEIEANVLDDAEAAIARAERKYGF